MNYLLLVLFVFLLIFIHPSNFYHIEHLTNSTSNTSTSTSTNPNTTANNCDCSLIQSISTLTTEYASLNSRVGTLENTVKDVKSIATQNQTDLKRINGLIQQLEEATKEQS